MEIRSCTGVGGLSLYASPLRTRTTPHATAFHTSKSGIVIPVWGEVITGQRFLRSGEYSLRRVPLSLALVLQTVVLLSRGGVSPHKFTSPRHRQAHSRFQTLGKTPYCLPSNTIATTSSFGCISRIVLFDGSTRRPVIADSRSVPM